MTFRNLNTSIGGRLEREYRRDLEDGKPHPICYLLYEPSTKKDLFYEIAAPVDPVQVRRRVGMALRGFWAGEPLTWNDDVIKIWPRRPAPAVVDENESRVEQA